MDRIHEELDAEILAADGEIPMHRALERLQKPSGSHQAKNTQAENIFIPESVISVQKRGSKVSRRIHHQSPRRGQ